MRTPYLTRFPSARRLWDRSLPPPVADAGRRSVGNRKERTGPTTMRVPRRMQAGEGRESQGAGKARDYASSPGRSSAGGNGRERLTLPDSKEISSAEWLGLFLCPRGALSPGPSPGGCIHRTWLGFRPRAALWDRSRAPPVAEAARRSVGNRKERLRDYASSPGETARLETA